MEVSLVRVTPSDVKGAVSLSKERTVFGRGDDATIRVPVSKVSRRHCEVVVTGAGDITVRDLNSSNGTFVNQERVTERPLAAGDLLSFGGIVFVVRVNGEPGEIDAGLMFEDGLPDSEEGPAVASSGGAGREPLVPAMDPDDSSISDFEFDMDDEDEQPPL